MSKTVATRGRLDILALGFSRKAIESLERQWRCTGLWDLCEPFLKRGVKGISPRRVPEPIMQVLERIYASQNRG